MGGTVYVDTDETQRELVSTTNSSLLNVKVEMPRNAAYQNRYGPYFIPSNSIVEMGDRLTWENQDYIAHTATSSDGTTFDTGNVLPGSSVSIIVPHHQGVITYYCKIHPWMIGTVTISS
jgi:plastocyanin